MTIIKKTVQEIGCGTFHVCELTIALGVAGIITVLIAAYLFAHRPKQKTE